MNATPASTPWQRLHALLEGLVLAPVLFYRRVLSPLKRMPTCRYLPTCSEYAIDAVRKRGILVGSVLAIARILRCNPLFHGGYHPVSSRRQASACCAAHVREGQV
jgi:hypothetical protein